jgi:hypothetical protein
VLKERDEEERQKLIEHESYLQMQAERDSYAEIANNCCKPALAKINELQATITTLCEALEKYGNHIKCDIKCGYDCDLCEQGIKHKCTCGFSAALASVRGEK